MKKVRDTLRKKIGIFEIFDIFEKFRFFRKFFIGRPIEKNEKIENFRKCQKFRKISKNLENFSESTSNFFHFQKKNRRDFFFEIG